MTNMEWVITGLIIVLLLGLIGYGFVQMRRAQKRDSEESLLPAEPEPEDRLLHLKKNDIFGNTTQSVAPPPKTEKFVCLHVARENNAPYDGETIHSALREAQLHYDHNHEVYVCHYRDRGGPILFYVTNSLNPGFLRPEESASLSTIGVSLIFLLPCEIEATRGFNIFLEKAAMLAERLGGQVRCEDRALLTTDRAEQIYKNVQSFAQAIK